MARAEAPGRGAPRLAVVAAVNDEASLARNLAASPILAEGRAEAHYVRGAPSASIAYNAGLDAVGVDIVIFAHQDVYLPASFEAGLRRAAATLDRIDPDWAVAGIVGIDEALTHAGRAWSSGLGRAIDNARPEPVRAHSIDEMVMVIRAASGLRFDPKLPHFHLYGTDIVQIARAAGLGAWILDLPVVHNSRFVSRLGLRFAAAYRHLQRKWRDRLPIRTPILWITRSGYSLLLVELLLWRSRSRRARSAVSDLSDPAEIAAAQRWEDAPAEDRAE